MIQKRRTYTPEFKDYVVNQALQRPPDERIKPTCREFPSVRPVQLRRWIRLRQHQPNEPCESSESSDVDVTTKVNEASEALLTLHTGVVLKPAPFLLPQNLRPVHVYHNSHHQYQYPIVQYYQYYALIPPR